jgi:serine/threonine protein kinase
LQAATKLSVLHCENEVHIHSRLFHPNIVEFHEWFSDRQTGKICFVLEYCHHGTLRQIAEQCDGGILPQEAVQRWMHQLYSALTYLHEEPIRVAHRDINPNNLLLHSDLSLKLTDFGLASKLQPDGRQLDGLMGASVGTVNYIAPEVLLRSESDLRAADVWSCGVVMYEMLMGHAPFDLQPKRSNNSNNNNNNNNVDPAPVCLQQFPSVERLCTASAEVIGACLDRNFMLRPSARSLCRHRFFTFGEGFDSHSGQSRSPGRSCHFAALISDGDVAGGGELTSRGRSLSWLADIPPELPAPLCITNEHLLGVAPAGSKSVPCSFRGGSTDISLATPSLPLPPPPPPAAALHPWPPPAHTAILRRMFLDPHGDRRWITAAQAAWVPMAPYREGRSDHAQFQFSSDDEDDPSSADGGRRRSRSRDSASSLSLEV